METLMTLGTWGSVGAWWGYEKARVRGVLLVIQGDVAYQFHRDVAAEFGRPHADNKEVYRLDHEKDEPPLYVSFWDGTMSVGTGIFEVEQ